MFKCARNTTCERKCSQAHSKRNRTFSRRLKYCVRMFTILFYKVQMLSCKYLQFIMRYSQRFFRHLLSDIQLVCSEGRGIYLFQQYNCTKCSPLLPYSTLSNKMCFTILKHIRNSKQSEKFAQLLSCWTEKISVSLTKTSFVKKFCPKFAIPGNSAGYFMLILHNFTLVHFSREKSISLNQIEF